MDVFLIIMAFVCLLFGIVGSVVPGLPGPPISWVGLMLAGLTPWVSLSGDLILFTAIVAAVITVLDYVVPSLFTKKLGGSNYGIWGCNIGLIISLFGLPFVPGIVGVVVLPFLGALIGEFIKNQQWESAVKAAIGAFLGFLVGTLLKLAYCIALLVVVIVAFF